MNALKRWTYNPNLNDWLFTAMILSFPVGSKFISLSLGFMTIYPYFVLLMVLALFGLMRKPKFQTNLQKFYLFFLAFFLLYATIQLPFCGSIAYGIIDIRSIVLMGLTGFVILDQFNFLGLDKWRNSLRFSFQTLFILLVLVGFLEFVSGMHLVGKSTEHIIERGIVDLVTYSPLFTWDNPNNFLVYLILTGTAAVLLEARECRRNAWAIVVFGFGFFFCALSMSRLGELICLISLTLHAAQLGLNYVQKIPLRSKQGILLIYLLVSVFAVYLLNEKFYGIPNERKMRLTALAPMHPELNALYEADKKLNDSLKGAPAPLSKQVPPDSVEYRNSDDERVALVKNGIDFFVQSRLVGVGPGQFRYLHDEGKVDHYAHGNNGAHFWLVELFSQFGVANLLVYLFLFGWIAVRPLSWWKSNRSYAILFLLALMIFFGVSIMPSAFLILDIHWIFTGVLVVLAGLNVSQLSTPSND